MGFFSPEVLTQRSSSTRTITSCTTCGLHKKCRSPKMPLHGKGRRGILIVDEAPGEEDDLQGRPFAGSAGRLLRDELDAAGVDLFRDCWITHAVACRPQDNRDPSAEELDSCLPNIVNAARETQPSVVICLDRYGVTQTIGLFWKTGVGAAYRWLGHQIPCVEWNSWICPTYHPAFVRNKIKDGGVEGLLWKRHLKAACRLTSRPWASIPDYRSRIRCLRSPSQAAAAVQDFIRSGVPVAFDYETDRLKPEHSEARIVSASVSDGEHAVSFPWAGGAVGAVRDLLWSDVPKMGWNIKFEERWTRKVFGRGVRNWLWDGMQASHVLDNRPSVTSLKFQAFVRMGVSSYDAEMAPYLSAENGNARNRVHEADVDKVLFYGGMDALCTAVICKQQMEEM